MNSNESELKDPLLIVDGDPIHEEDDKIATAGVDEDEEEDTNGGGLKAKLKECVKQSCGFELRFWICTVSCFLCYGIVQAYNYNSETVLLERNYFTAPQDITECCCWQNDRYVLLDGNVMAYHHDLYSSSY